MPLVWLVVASFLCVTSGCARSKCDLPKLHALTKSIAHQERDAPQLVAKGLGQACELPPALAGFFAASAVTRVPQSEQLRGLPRPERFDEVLALACPQSAREQIAAAVPETKLSLAYDLCEFASLGVEDKATWLATNPSWPDPFVTYSWLKDQGVTEAAARPLARAMIAHDRHHWAEVGQDLPEVGFELPPLPNNVADPVYLNDKALLYRGNKLASVLVTGELEASAVKGMQVKLLARELASAKAEQGPLLVVSERRVSAAAIQKVFFTAHQAGFHRVGLVLKTDPESYGMVPVSLVKARQSLDVSGAKGLAIDLELDDDTVFLRLSNDPTNQQVINTSEFGAWAATIRNLFPGQVAATVVPGAASYDELARLLAELRGPCLDAASEHACVEPGVVILKATRDRLEIQVDGRVRFRGKLLTLESLSKPLCAAVSLRGAEHLAVEVAADPETPHGHVIEVIDLVRKCGATKVSIVTN
ncbi:MAG: ExbD/TolR family protein [Nannocystaceae bacterium]